MKKIFAFVYSGLIAFTLSVGTSAAGAADKTAVKQEAQTKTIAVSEVAPRFAKPVSLRGTLGDQNVQLDIRPKEPAEDGIEGNYFVFGQSRKILVAGEFEDDQVFLEESENGKDVSGHWQGILVDDTFKGEWVSVDTSTTKPFHLKVVKTSLIPAKAVNQTKP